MAAWKFARENQKIHPMEVVAINPSGVIGPAFDEKLNTTCFYFFFYFFFIFFNF
jgi:hypothetical protein